MKRAAVNDDVGITIGVDHRLRFNPFSFKQSNLELKKSDQTRVLVRWLAKPAVAMPHFD